MGDGRIEGNDAEDPNAPLSYEPHHDTITLPDQVQIYEPIMLNTDGEVTYTLLRTFSYAKDNRLLPAGFDKNNVSGDIAILGDASNDPNFVGGSDQVAYEINVAGAKGRFSITVELLYQILSCPFVADLANSNTDLVNRFLGMYDPAENVPVKLGWTQISVR